MPNIFISSAECPAITLHFLGNKVQIIGQCREFALSNTSIQKEKYETVKAIIKAFPQCNSTFWGKSMNIKCKLDEFDGGFAAVDGTHVPIRVRAKETDKYRNKKGFVSTNLLVCFNLKERVLFLGIGSPGSFHDSTIFKTSALFTELQKLPDDRFIFADTGYGLSDRVLQSSALVTI